MSQAPRKQHGSSENKAPLGTDNFFYTKILLNEALEEGKKLARELNSVKKKPWLPLQTAALHFTLKAIIKFRPLLTQRKYDTLIRSINKRSPSKSTANWQQLENIISNSFAGIQHGDSHPASRVPTAAPSPHNRKVICIHQGNNRQHQTDTPLNNSLFLQHLHKLGFKVEFHTLESATAEGKEAENQRPNIDTIEQIRHQEKSCQLILLIDADPTNEFLDEIFSINPSIQVILTQTKTNQDASIYPTNSTLQHYTFSTITSNSENQAKYLSTIPPANTKSPTTNPIYEETKNISLTIDSREQKTIEDAVWFSEKIWPLIKKQLPETELHIHTSSKSIQQTDLKKIAGLRFITQENNTNQYTSPSSYRLAIHPFTTSTTENTALIISLDKGLPTICTHAAAQAIQIKHRIHALVANNEIDFLNQTIECYQNRELWQSLSTQGKSFISENFGVTDQFSSFVRMLDKAQCLPLDIWLDYCSKKQIHTPSPINQDFAPEVSIVIPVYNKWQLTRQCINSVITAATGTGITYEIIIADDGSSDGTLHALTEFPQLKIIRSPINQGFLKNCNHACNSASGKYLVLLNNDTIVLPNWLISLYNTIKTEPDIGIVGSKFIFQNGIILEAGGLIMADGSTMQFGMGDHRHASKYNYTRDVDYISGASIMLRSSLWKKIGGFDEQYIPAYYEDTDFAMAVRKEKLRVVYQPASEVIHFEHASYSRNEALDLLGSTNNKKFVKKWADQLKNEHLSSDYDFDAESRHAALRSPFNKIQSIL
jgi:GT2 family glycosyltransferase/5S rRNA maturation endonuclease (ribonuclease M5)